MRVVPVPDWIRRAEWVERTQVFAAPDGDLTNQTIAPAEGIIYKAEVDGSGATWPCVGVVILIEEDDAEAIRQGAREMLLAWPGVMPVFMVPELLIHDVD